MKKADIIILSGQSNAVGVGYVRYLPAHFPAETVDKWLRGYKDIQINYFSHDKKSGGFVDTTVNCAEQTKDTFGPELGIADALDLRYPGKKFFIVKCAFGGMSLYKDYLSPSGGPEYDAGSFADQLPSIVKNIEAGAVARYSWCYNELVKITRESIDAIKGMGYEPEIKAFCWMQGENESCDAGRTAVYGRLYDCFLADLKKEFAGYIENCVFIDGGISTVWPFYKELNEIKRNYAAEHENCVFIDTIAAGLTTEHEPEGEPDIYHYDSDCVIKLGHLFAEHIKP